jgi:hypothetical protein
MFLCDDRITLVLPRFLGKDFIKSKKYALHSFSAVFAVVMCVLTESCLAGLLFLSLLVKRT